MDLTNLIKSCEEYSFPSCENCPCFKNGECLYITETRIESLEKFDKE